MRCKGVVALIVVAGLSGCSGGSVYYGDPFYDPWDYGFRYGIYGTHADIDVDIDRPDRPDRPERPDRPDRPNPPPNMRPDLPDRPPGGFTGGGRPGGGFAGGGRPGGGRSFGGGGRRR